MKELVIIIDGCGPEYLHSSDMHTLEQLNRECPANHLSAIVPTVTNVNCASIVTGNYPDVHGVCGNFWRNPDSGLDQYVEAPELLRCPTVFEIMKSRGCSTALLTVKEKLRTLLKRGVDFSMSVEQPAKIVMDGIGAPPPVYSIEANYWLMQATTELIRQGMSFDLVFIFTSDYPMHMFSPEDEQAQEYLHQLDALLGQALETMPSNTKLIATADHGMNLKVCAINPAKVLARENIEADVVPIIKDRYVVHHANLGGSVYLYLQDESLVLKAAEILRKHPRIELVLTRKEAATKFHLLPERIGDLLILGDKHTVFGDGDQEEQEVNIRSHGSLYEQQVPLFTYGVDKRSKTLLENKDILHLLIEDREVN